MQTVALVLLSFFGAWLLLYLDHRAKFVELFFDIPGLLFGMMVAFIILYLVWSILNLAFQRTH
jgi:hypothetical protein